MSIVFLCLLVFFIVIVGLFIFYGSDNLNNKTNENDFVILNIDKLYKRAKKSDLMKNYKIAQLKNGKYKIIEKGKPIVVASKYLRPVDTLEKVKENYVRIYLIMKEKDENKVERYIE